MSQSSLEELSLDSIRKGSKTFSLAARFFSKEELESAAKIYFWCRHCDDVIDEGPSTEKSLQELRAATFGEATAPQFVGFQKVCSAYHIPALYPSELLEGMRMDLEETSYQTIDDLLLYCYRVAGTVGLMMSHVMGLYDEKALKQAASLGMAMQLTNISRDIKEDFDRGRVYLPQGWLEEEGIGPQDFLTAPRAKMKKVVGRLLEQAEIFYQEAQAGISHLPLRSALTVTIAKNLYREIGREVLRREQDFLEERVVVSSPRKIWLVLASLGEILMTVPARIFDRREVVTITSVWRPS